MKGIQVVPDQLDALGAEFRRAEGELSHLQWALARAAGSLDWEVRSQADVEEEIRQARSRAGLLAEGAGRMAQFLAGKADAFRSADAVGTGLVNAIRLWMDQERQRPSLRPEDVKPLLGLGALLGAGIAAIPVLDNPGWFFGDKAKPSVDAFWDSLAQPPLVAGANGLAFSPELAVWADKFNASVRKNWAGKQTDHAGTAGAQNLIDKYLLTPEKVQQIWDAARENHVDPRLLLAILKQEGTGSFNTNPVNADHFDGHGPEPHFAADLAAALDGPICAKLRLYGAAAAAGFQGTWIDWCNWYTPIDSKGFAGAPGVYAADIHWGAGVEASYREIAGAVGGGSGVPVADYSRWMGENSDLFKPKHIEGEFVLKQGIRPGTKRPDLALWGDYPKPTPDAEKVEPWWWFPAPDAYCWYIERK